MADVSVAVDTTTPNAVQATSATDIAPWMTSTSFAGWHGNFGGTGTARNAGSRPYYQGDGTSANPGPVVTQAMDRYAEVAGYLLINAFAYNSATGNPWPDPTQDCPAADTVSHPYYAHSATGGTGAIPYKDGDGYFWPPTPANGVDSGNPWATLDLKVMQARALCPKSQIVLCMRAAPGWMTAAWQGSTTSGGSANINTPTEPNKVLGNPPLFMKVVASGTASTSIGFCGLFSSGVSAGASGGTLKGAGTGQWGSGTALIGVSNGDTLILAPGTANEETVTLSALNTSTGVFSISGTFAHAHAANVLAVKLGGTRIISSFFGGNTCSSGLAASGYSPGTGNVWTFFDCMARLARRVAERYPFIQLYSSWGEPGNTTAAAVTSSNDTGAWLQTNNVWWADDGSGHTLQASPAFSPGGRNNIPIGTVLFNKTWQALKGVPGRNYSTFPLSFGGPHHSCGAPTNATALQSFDDGVYTVFLTNAAGLDFVSFDGFTYGNTYSPTAPDADPSAALGRLADATTGLLAGIGAIRTKATAFGYGSLPIWQMESYHDSNLSHLDYSNPSAGPAVTNWFTHQAQAMCLTSILYYAILGGVAMHPRWQAEGSASASSFNGYKDSSFGGTYNLESLVSVTDVAGTGLTAAALGLPFPAHTAFKAVRDNFGPGTALVTAAVTDGSATTGKTMLALASATHLVLINQYPASKTVDVAVDSGAPTTVTVPAYGVTVVALSGGGGGGGGGGGVPGIYGTSLFLSVGDTVTFSGGDYIPDSGDYLNLLDANGILCLEGGLIIPTSKEPADQKKAGAVIRIRSVRSQPIKSITLHLLLNAGGTDATTWRRLWASIEHKLEQAAAASGPFGHGVNVCLLVRFATGPQASSLGGNFTAFDVLGGVATQNDVLTNPGQAYGMTLELRCLMHGRLTAARYPLLNNTFSALAQQTPTLYLGPASSGPIPGHLGALAQIHIDDTSSAGHINRVRIGRRNVPGAGGGMAATDWQGVVPVAAALGSATTSTSGGTYGKVGANFATITVSDSLWHDVAALYISGTNPLHQSGIYDCYLRVRENATVFDTPSITSLSSATLASTLTLIPDTYNVRVAVNNGAQASAASPIATITTQYSNWPPNLIYESFESGDTAAGIELTNTSLGTGKLAVETHAALAGSYGLHVALYASYPKDASTALYYPQPSQIYRRPIAVKSTTDLLACGCWVEISALAAGNQIVLLGIGSSRLLNFNYEGAGTDGITGAPQQMGQLMQGLLCAIAIDGGDLSLITWNNKTGYVSTPFAVLGAPITPAHVVGQKVYLQMEISTATIPQSTPYTVTAQLLAENTASLLSVTSPGIGNWAGTMTGAVTADYVDLGARLTAGAGMANLFYDDLWAHQNIGGTHPNPAPDQGIVVASSDGGIQRRIYIQRQSDLWYFLERTIAQNHVLNLGDAFGVEGSPPEQAVPSAALIRPRVGIHGSADFLTGTPVPTELQGNLWHLLYLGTYALPPVQRFEGLNPTFGSGAGDFPFEMDVQVQSGSGALSNTIQIDALFLVPHEEPQIVAGYPALNNTSLLSEWVLDSRRDGRSGAVLRSTSDWTTIQGQAETIGHMELGSGNQILIFLVEREGGIHDAAGTSFGVAVRYQPLVDFIDDDPSAY